MIKLIATDMDGTFLDSSKRFSMEFFDIFTELRKKGIKFVIASGNQYFRLYQKFLPISNEMYFIAFLGKTHTQFCCYNTASSIGRIA